MQLLLKVVKGNSFIPLVNLSMILNDHLNKIRKLIKEGKHITVASTSYMNIEALKAAKILKEKGIDSVIFKESDVIFDKESRILISSFQKVGTGFSHDKLDMLILGVDTEEYFLQYLGRVFRRKDSSPIILDIVDEHPVLWKHFRTRSKVYRESGGQISVKK